MSGTAGLLPGPRAGLKNGLRQKMKMDGFIVAAEFTADRWEVIFTRFVTAERG
jgi:hypothetical protein